MYLIKESIKALLAARLMQWPNKVRFDRAEVKRLGYVTSQGRISIENDRIQPFADLPQPTTIKEFQSTLGAVNFARNITPNLVDVV